VLPTTVEALHWNWKDQRCVEGGVIPATVKWLHLPDSFDVAALRLSPGTKVSTFGRFFLPPVAEIDGDEERD
jgi:hypothetical protein